MKQVYKEITTTKVEYQAEDGTVFDSEKECQEYEKSAHGALTIQLHKYVVNKQTEAALYETGSDDYEILVVRVADSDAYRVISQLLAISKSFSDSKDVELVSVMKNQGLVVLGHSTYDDCYYYLGVAQDIINKYTKFFSGC